MVYIIPEQFNEKWNLIILYIEKLNTLKIKYNHKKAKFPRLYNSKKKGIESSYEIYNLINFNFISKKYWLEELCFCLKYKFQIKKNENDKKILYTDRQEVNERLFFNSHILI